MKETPVYQFADKKTWSGWTWKERFPAQEDVFQVTPATRSPETIPELAGVLTKTQYMKQAAEKWNLRKYMMFNTRLQLAGWDQSKQCWTLHADGKVLATTKFFIPCTGYAGEKYVPDLKGLASFKHAYHTSQYPEHFSCDKKRVGVIGTGSSGMQTIETIGPKVGHLTVFQRNPNYCNPRHQQHLTAESEAAEQKDYVKRFEGMQKTPTGLEVTPIDRNTFEDDIEQRLANYNLLWSLGAQHYWFGGYRDLLTDKQANKEAYGFWRNKTRPRIHDPVKRELLAPLKPPYAFGTKRPSLESSYFEVYNQPNVDLVDLKTDAIEEVTEKGVLMASGSFHALDVIIIATGYDFGIGSLLAIDIRGTDGVSLLSKWADGPSSDHGNGVYTHLGIMTAGFPNMFFPAGPQAPTAFGITPRLSELQGQWLVDCMAYVRDHGYATIEPTNEAEKQWKVANREAADKTLIPLTDGWYMGNNIPGRKKEPLFWFGGVQEYMKICRDSAEKGYEGFVLH